MACREVSTGNCCKICQGITSLRSGCTLALLPAQFLRRCGTRKLAPIYHYRTIDMKENTENSLGSSNETRCVFIGAKVTPRQKEHIKSLAAQCGMTVSDYILSCAYNFKPRARLTKEEAALLQNLDDCRSDLVKYTSALHGMSTKQRMTMFNQIPFMVGWLKELGNVAESVCQFLSAVKEHNKIPFNAKSEEI